MSRISADSALDLLRFGVLLEQFVLAQTRRNRSHSQTHSSILFFCLLLTLSPHRSHRLLLPFGPSRPREGGVMGERPNFFKFVEELDVGLSDFLVMFVVAMCEGSTFGVSELLLLSQSGAVECQLIFPFFPDLF